MNRLVCAVLSVIAVPVLGCTWVPLTDRGADVRIIQEGEAAGCQKIGTVSSKTTERILIFPRSDLKVREELESLARNEAADSGGNVIVPTGTMADGRQSFDVYRCEER